jgi:hypothetical protein
MWPENATCDSHRDLLMPVRQKRGLLLEQRKLFMHAILIVRNHPMTGELYSHIRISSRTREKCGHLGSSDSRAVDYRYVKVGCGCHVVVACNRLKPPSSNAFSFVLSSSISLCLDFSRFLVHFLALICQTSKPMRMAIPMMAERIATAVVSGVLDGLRGCGMLLPEAFVGKIPTSMDDVAMTRRLFQ